MKVRVLERWNGIDAPSPRPGQAGLQTTYHVACQVIISNQSALSNDKVGLGPVLRDGPGINVIAPFWGTSMSFANSIPAQKNPHWVHGAMIY